MTALAIRAQARRDIHAQFAVAATYTDSIQTTPVALTARWHGQTVHPIGDFEGAGYAEILERVDHIIFNREELALALSGGPLTLRRNGIVAFPDYGASFKLDIESPADGPINVTWTVTPEARTRP